MDLKKFVAPAVVVLALVATGLAFLGGESHKTLTAHFPRAISVFEGSEVRVLGVPVGTVDSVTPSGTDVVVTMRYDADVDLPADAQAVIVAPSIVGDRFVQLTPAYTGGDKLADGAELETDRTAVPLELDQVYSSLNDLNVALGPRGANRKGALSDLLAVTADNFGGQGEQFHRTIKDFGRFSGTLENNEDEIFDTATRLQSFITTLADNDRTVRRFNDSLAEVSTMLEGEREELSAALRNLARAMTHVSSFVKDNRKLLGDNIQGLKRVTGVLAKRRDAVDEILSAGPVALNNLALTYNPQAGTLDTRANMGELVNQLTSDPSTFLCGLLSQADQSGEVCDLVEEVLPRTSPLAAGGPRGRDVFDPSLGGLVEVTR